MDYGSEDGRVDEEKSELGEVVRYEEIKNEDGDSVSVPVIRVGKREVSAADIDFAADSIYSNIDGMDVDVANEMISAYKKHGEGLKASDFAAEWRLAYQMGLANRSAESADFKGHRFNITPEAAEAARAFGQAEYRGERTSREGRIKEAQRNKTGREGAISTEKVQNKKLITDGARTAAKVLSVAGYNVEFFEDVSESADRGSYDWDTNTIRLNVAVGTGRGGIDYVLGRTLSHELVHSIQRWNPEGYEELKGFIIEKMGDSFEGMVSRKMKRLGLSYDGAVDEVIADGCEMMLKNSKSLTEFAKKHRTLFEKICDVVEEFIGKIRNAISSLYGDSTSLHDEARFDEARFMELYADELQKVFDKALSDALNASEATVDHSLQSNANKETAENGGKVQYSKKKRNFSYEYLVSKDNLIGTTIGKNIQVPIDKNGGIDLSKILEIIKNKCRKISHKSINTYFVNIPDIKCNVEVSRDGIKHSFFRGIRPKSKLINPKVILNARVSLDLPNILKNSIEVNRSDRDNSPTVLYSSILIGVTRIENPQSPDGYDYCVVRSIVQHNNDKSKLLKEANVVGYLNATKAKKIDQHNALVIANATSATQSDLFEYSVSDLLNDVKGIFDDTFSEDVYAHFNMKRRENEHFSKHLQYSRSENEVDIITPEEEADVAEYRKAEFIPDLLRSFFQRYYIINICIFQ